MFKRILNRFGHPPDLQEAAVKEVLAQAALPCADWAARFPHHKIEECD
jgi:type I restriction enzyme R subunit